jgi:uncharacterized protein YdeI (YjbR/CyaY-like superfamily)
MDMVNLLEATTRDKLREWLATYSTTEKCCWVIVSMREEAGVIQYLDAVEEALCFGWVDGVKKKISPTELAQRLSPRQKNSNWTELNKERVRRLEKLGMMTEEGRRILPNMHPEAFVIDNEILDRLKADEETYQNFLGFPELYRRIRIDTIQSYKNDADLFNKRMDKFIENTKLNKMYGQWHDKGRLLDY